MTASTNSILAPSRATGDLWGIAVAVTCALHCLAAPIAVTAAPLLVSGWLEHPALEWGLVALSVVSSAVILWRGHRRHSRGSAILPFMTGTAMLLSARLAPALDESTERLLVGAAALALVSAHVINLRYAVVRGGRASARRGTTDVHRTR